MPEERRQHIQDVIDRHRLPVTHVTVRRGRLYALVLTKQKALFERDAALREQQKALLAWLKKHRSAFRDHLCKGGKCALATRDERSLDGAETGAARGAPSCPDCDNGSACNAHEFRKTAPLNMDSPPDLTAPVSAR